MQRVENIVNRFSDMDWGWWPLLALRPAKDQDITNLTLVKLACFFGPVTGLLLLLVRLRRMPRVTVESIVLYVVVGSLLFLALSKLSIVACWNRRAKRLRNSPLSRKPAA